MELHYQPKLVSFMLFMRDALAPRIEHLLPNVKLPFQPAPARQHTG